MQPVIDILSGHISKDGTSGLWWVDPQSKPQDLGAILENAGLQPVGETPAMATDLTSLDGTLPASRSVTSSGRGALNVTAGPVSVGTALMISACGQRGPALHASPAVSKSTVSSASAAVLPAQTTNWKA